VNQVIVPVTVKDTGGGSFRTCARAEFRISRQHRTENASFSADAVPISMVVTDRQRPEIQGRQAVGRVLLPLLAG